MDNFTREQDGYTMLALLFFILATLFIQITLLNMLIAIMGDSFSYAMENKKIFATRTKLGILKTQAPVLR